MNLPPSFLTTEYVRQWCDSATIFQRGLNYYKQGRVFALESEEDGNGTIWYAIVNGSESYKVEITIHNRFIFPECSCPAYETRQECKHIIAVLLEIADLQELRKYKKNQPFPSRKYERANQMIDIFSNGFALEKEDRQTGHKQPLQVEYICRTCIMGVPPGKKLFNIELKVGTKRPYVVKNIGKFLQAITDHSNYFFTNNFSYLPSDHYFMEEDEAVLQILQEIRKQEEFYGQKNNMYGYYSSSEKERFLTIPPMMADQLVSTLQGRKVSFDDRGYLNYQPYSEEVKVPLHFSLEKGEEEDFLMDLSSLNDISFFEAYGWIVEKDTIYKLSPVQQDLFLKILQMRRHYATPTLPISKSQMGPFISYVLPEIKRIGTMDLADEVLDQITSPELIAKIFIDWQDERLSARIEYHYGDVIIDPFATEVSDVTDDKKILIRDREKEQEIMKVIEGTPFKYNGKECYIEGEEDTFDFLFVSVPRLEEKAEIYMSGNVRSLILPGQYSPVTRIDMDRGGNLLEISFDMEGIEGEEVRNILQSVVEKKKFYRLPNGAFLSLEDEGFKTIDRLFSELHMNKSQLQEGVLTLPVYRGLQVEGIMNGTHHIARLGKKFRRFIQDLKNPDTLDYEVPATLNATMRDYQLYGFQWLKTMAKYGLGGILADDMGLGKTLQGISYLLSEKMESVDNRVPSLVVAPASLVYNWKSEFDKFAPDLDVIVAYGAPEERISLLQERNPDVFITSYPLLRQDLEYYEKITFDSLILDEAQAIKNHLTKTAQAVKQIKAGRRFAFSGTPIENSLDELWSIFDAILPGFFHNQKTFRNLEHEKIATMVRPFILRRVKQDVLKELPDKIETVYQSDLTKTQKELYLAYLEKIKQETKESIRTEGFDKSRMKILAGLTRLRQLCCHPSLFIENYTEQSGKLEQLLEIIENAMENKRRLLVFSQFTGMLQIIRDELDQTGIGYFYLDGKTPSKERVEMANRFNHGENNLFLISLKAGGTGLNLTGADTVILYDLWWNPAVEEQAAGRAHRMGQKNTVQVMRLVARGTIEEKIYEMQQKKRELIEQVIQPGEGALASLSEEDIKEILGI